MREAGELEKARDRLTKARSFAEDVLTLFRQTADLQQGLIDRRDVDGFIRLGVQGWIDAEAKAIDAKRGKLRKPPNAKSSLPGVPNKGT